VDRCCPQLADEQDLDEVIWYARVSLEALTLSPPAAAKGDKALKPKKEAPANKEGKKAEEKKADDKKAPAGGKKN
jgi:ribosomal protein L12E/L44/L45/RPP1/RPP2